MKNLYVLYTISLLMAFSLKTFSQTPAQRHIAKPKGTTSLGFGYYEYLPSNYSAATDLPVVIFFHGMGEKGNGTTELIRVKKNGPPKLVDAGKDFPFILLSIQHYSGWWRGDELASLIKYVKSNYKVDINRIYITGLSAGGISTWSAGVTITSELAAIVPIAGNGNVDNAFKAINLPIWAFHNSGDRSVSSSGTINMVNAVKLAGGNPKTTIYLSNSHDAWTAAYNDQKMWDWLLAQRKGSNVSVNQNPYVNAGSDKTLTLPSNSITLTASASDKDGSIKSYKWDKVSGQYFPATYTTTPTLKLTSMPSGTYVFMISVQDNTNATAYDLVTVVVNQPVNEIPIVSAGEDQIITLPANSLTLTASSSDPDGTITSITWSQVSGSAATLIDSTTSNLSISNLNAGTYGFRATVKDNNNATASDEVTVTVHQISASAPLVSAGADSRINLPKNTITLVGTSSAPGGSIISRNWIQLSGPTATMADANTSYLKLTNLTAGTYVFRFIVKDNSGLTSSDDVTLIVNAPPIVSAGVDKKVFLPKSMITMVAAWSDEDGFVASRKWTKLSGPSVTLTDINTSYLKASDLVPGVYVFRVTVMDNFNASAYDDVQITIIDESSARLVAPEISSEEINIYPNPAIDKINLNLNTGIQEDAEIKILNASDGKVVLTNELTVNGTTLSEINISHLNAGIYLVKIKTSAGEKNIRFIKQ